MGLFVVLEFKEMFLVVSESVNWIQ